MAREIIEMHQRVKKACNARDRTADIIESTKESEWQEASVKYDD